MKFPKINFFIFIRFALGLVFIVSGAEKLISPWENFFYVIQGYQIIGIMPIEILIAKFFPWLELILGTFLLLGIWLKISLLGLWVFTSSFVVIVAQAIIRKLPINKCGCFGDLVKVPLAYILTMDICFWFLFVLLLYSLEKTRCFSLDRYYEKN